MVKLQEKRGWGGGTQKHEKEAFILQVGLPFPRGGKHFQASPDSIVLYN